MAVVKTSALGQVRKSIGATNYYRRSGVQLARQKPTFAPGRTFTAPQLRQQDLMKGVKMISQQMDLAAIARNCNTYNSRIYNTSSRYNRLVSKLLKGLANAWDDAEMTIEEVVSYGMDTWAAEFSTGNIPFPLDLTVSQFNTTNILFDVAPPSAQASQALALANKKKKGRQYSMIDIGVVGFVTKKWSGGATTRLGAGILPSFVVKSDNPFPDPDKPYMLNCSLSNAIPGTAGDYVIYLAAFIKDSVIYSVEQDTSNALWTSSTYKIDYSK